MSRRFRLGLVASILSIFFIIYLSLGSSSPASHADLTSQAARDRAALSTFSDATDGSLLGLPAGVLTGGTIAPKLENATAKQELGRASWRLLHTMMARFPEKPTPDDSLALQAFMQLFARLYPCGQCAAHFQKMLGQYPPQTSSRNAAAGWACFVHNEVNKRLHKEIFDCAKIGDFYDCGCGDDDKSKGAKTTLASGGALGGTGNEAVLRRNAQSDASLTLEKDGLTRGG